MFEFADLVTFDSASMTTMTQASGALENLIGREVVLDVSSPFVYVGTFAGEDHGYLVLESADVHDLRDTKTTRELYLLDARRFGIHENRKRVLVRQGEVVSLSALEDVIQ